MDNSETAEVLRPLRIFVVEDDPEMQKTYRFYFESYGHTMSAAFGMQYALERLATNRYDVLIVDIGLPDGDGWELMRTVRFFHPLYAIAITSCNTDADRAKSKAAGFRHHLLKPWRLSELDAALREAARETAGS